MTELLALTDDFTFSGIVRQEQLVSESSYQIKLNHAAHTLEVAGFVQNIGDGPAHGPSEVTLGFSHTIAN
jgi:acylphosphatase